MGKKNSKLDPEAVEDLKHSTGFTETEIITWHKRFYAAFPDGKMKMVGLEKIYEMIFPFGDASKFAEHMFRRYDSNRDGSIDFREFLCAMSITSHGTTENKLKSAFNLYDIDGDGYITRLEMVAMITSIMDMTRPNITEGTLRTPVERTNRIFSILDKNKQGKLTLEEFIKGTRDYPEFFNFNL